MAIEELREPARGLPPAQLDAVLGPGAQGAGESSAAPRSRFAPAPCGFRRVRGGRVLHRLARDSTNAVKHADASRVMPSASAEQRSACSCRSRMTASAARRGARARGLSGLTDRVVAQGGRCCTDPKKPARRKAQTLNRRTGPCGSWYRGGLGARRARVPRAALVRRSRRRRRLTGDAEHLTPPRSRGTFSVPTSSWSAPDAPPASLTRRACRKAIKQAHPQMGVMVLSQHIERPRIAGRAGHARRIRLPAEGPGPRCRRVPAGGGSEWQPAGRRRLDPQVVARLLSPRADAVRSQSSPGANARCWS